MITTYTIGHGNRGIQEFLGVLTTHQIRCVVDVRAHPGSRRHPHFSRTVLETGLAGADIDYVWEGASLGGMRTPSKASPHIALEAGMRGFADHMATPEFEDAIARVTALAEQRRTAIMCAEKLPSQCHRSLISDALTVRSVTVLHLIDVQPPLSHNCNKLVHVQDSTLVYGGSLQMSLL